MSRGVQATERESSPATPPRVFVSYSHDPHTPDHKARVLALANQLRSEGVDCELDQFNDDDPPPEGWEGWMERQIRESDFVVVVCTPTYQRRAHGTEVDGVGLGARWESQRIRQALYQAGGKNTKFVPVLLDAAHVDARPDFLAPTTYYVLPADYNKLYWRLTGQSSGIKAPLGRVRPRPDVTGGMAAAASGPGSGPEPLVLIADASGRETFIPLVSVEEADDVTLVLRPASGEERAVLDALRGNRHGSSRIVVGHDLTAYPALLTRAVRTVSGGEERYTLTLTPDRDRGHGVMEMSTPGYNVDRIAELRARRILLDERLPVPAGPYGADSMVESLVAGLSTETSVKTSPLPSLYARLGSRDPGRFVAAARLVAVRWLRLTGTVAHVLQFEARLVRADRLAVQFRGERARIYSNREPAVIEVSGECSLASR